MTSQPTISAIIPAFNHAESVVRSVESILAQTVPVDEIIIVDDASSDDIGAALASLMEPRIRLIRHEVNRGASAARNTGVRAASGDFIAFLDADDTWRPDKTAHQILALEQAGPDVLASVGSFLLHREGARAPDTYYLKLQTPLMRELAEGCKLGPGSTLMARRSVYDRVGYYDEDLRRLEDWDWLIRFSQLSEMAIVMEPIADIYLSFARGPVNMASTFTAIERIRGQHMATMRSRLGLVAALRFRARLSIERAAAFARGGQRWRAVLLLLKAYLIWPLPRREFFAQALRGLSGAFGKTSEIFRW